jgi:hypothetical protein
VLDKKNENLPQTHIPNFTIYHQCERRKLPILSKTNIGLIFPKNVCFGNALAKVLNTPKPQPLAPDMPKVDWLPFEK